MSRSLRIALAQLDFPVGDVAGNSARIVESMQVARDEDGADVVLFPELAISGYPPEDLLLRPSFLRDCEQALAAMTREQVEDEQRLQREHRQTGDEVAGLSVNPASCPNFCSDPLRW